MNASDPARPSKRERRYRISAAAFLALLLGLIPVIAASTGENCNLMFPARDVINDGIVADYAFHGYLYLPGGVPAVGDTVWVVNAARTDSLACVTDGDGRYENDPLTSVPDASRGLSLRAFPNPDPQTFIFESPDKTSGGAKMNLYDVRGREVTDDQRIPAGAYIARATTPSGENATVKVLFSQSAEPDKLSLEQRIINTPPAQTQKSPSQALDATVKVNKQEYEPVNQDVTLQPQGTTIIDDIILEANGVEYRIFGEAWNQRARDKVTGTITPRTHSDNNLHQAIIDTNATNHFDITITGYEPTEQVTIWIDNPHYTNNSTSVFPKGVVASTNNITRKLHEAPTTTLEELTNPQQGIFVYALADSVYNNPSFRQGLQDQNLGIIKDYPHQEMTHIIYTTNVTTGEPISQREIDEAQYVANYLHEQNTPRNGHTMLNSNIVTISTLPSDPIRTLFIYRGEWIGQGNGKIPANQPYFDRATAFVNSWDDVGYLFREAIEAMRVGDDASGNNGYAVSVNDNGEFIFSTLGGDMYYSAFFWSLENPSPSQ